VTNDPASLQNLYDIVLPPPAPFWPPAPGWLFLLGLFTLLLGFVFARGVIRYSRNAYRRAALAELGVAAASPEPLPLIAALLKRTALAAFPREEVAGLTGSAWVTWLAKMGGRAVPPPVETALKQGLYGGAAGEPKVLTDFAATWIRDHRGGV
jgi:hypothetical protein